MATKYRSGISTFSAQLTATVSVALVLLLLGIIALLGIAAHSVTNSIRENMGFDVVLAEDTPAETINTLKQGWISAPYVSNVKYYSAEDALAKWQDETGEDLMALLGVNPFRPEFEVKVKAAYANVDSIDKIVAPLRAIPQVSEINVHTEMVESINNNIRSIALVLTIVAAALLLISFVLINNTVRLTVYARRFIIHTMKLVGATPGFIRRPFVTRNILNGIVASLVAIALLAATLYYCSTLDTSVMRAITWIDAAWVFGGMMVAGILICALAALFAANKYIRLDYDSMFK